MTALVLDVSSYNIEMSFSEEVKAAFGLVQDAYNLKFGTSIDVASTLVTQGEIMTFPGGRLNFFSSNAASSSEPFTYETRCQLAFFTQELPSNPDQQINSIFRRNLLTAMGFTNLKTEFKVWFPTYDYVNDETGNTITGRKYAVTIDSREGWSALSDPDLTLRGYGIIFKLKHH